MENTGFCLFYVNVFTTFTLIFTFDPDRRNVYLCFKPFVWTQMYTTLKGLFGSLHPFLTLLESWECRSLPSYCWQRRKEGFTLDSFYHKATERQTTIHSHIYTSCIILAGIPTWYQSTSGCTGKTQLISFLFSLLSVSDPCFILEKHWILFSTFVNSLLMHVMCLNTSSRHSWLKSHQLIKNACLESEEADVPRENPHKHEENVKTPHRKDRHCEPGVPTSLSPCRCRTKTVKLKEQNPL